MSRFRFSRFLPLPLLTGSALLLTAALGQQNSPTPKPAPSPQKPADTKADPAAEKTLQAAIDLLHPTKLGWVETKVWEQVEAQGFSFEAQGDYLAGPDHRLRQDLKVHLGGSEGRSLIISDGNMVWNVVTVGKAEPVITKWDLKKVSEPLNNTNVSPEFAQSFFRAYSFAGIVPLLQSIRQQMVLTKQEEEEWNKHQVYKLTAVWSAELNKRLAPQPSNPWPVLVPRLCRIYLDRQAPYWPRRVEWWGPASQGASDTLLMQLEFRDPKFTPRDSAMPDRFARAFTFDPGKAEVVDRTQEMTANMAVQLSRQQPMRQKPAPADTGKPAAK
jgi:hypothetical protein